MSRRSAIGESPGLSVPWRLNLRRRSNPAPYLFLLPSLTLLGVFVFWPIVFAFILSFQTWDLVGQPNWVGLDNYARLAGDTVFWTALANTCYYAASVPLKMVLALAAALLVNQPIRGRYLFRTIIFLPRVISLVAV